ncbi:methionyl-tRNA formyltransferase [Pseudooctadecabacter jejudonensis]|uniref:Methionyl-tRNA formyltransferase n=1 Tax=Pseudooctadecabacter jejudonensis TaxID=1391910 RepID=A0A1Y5S3T4_9RHOB|nr:methionyl-tRNA formyltransferase [Pseudooctadecabacter jejudonensis]SLN29414.1 Methionyl-tRNA formyltransferase [Pseudooctadecabacter jejudonensis]
MRIVFMGTPDFSVPVLDALVNAGHEVVAVYCQPPRPAGRGKKERPTPVHARADDLGLMVRHPVSLKGVDAQADFAALDAEIAVVVAYGLILPQAILDAPDKGCLNIHASLLPRWRGAAPIHRAIMAGDSQTGVCIMQMDAGLDTGDVLLRRSIDIEVGETTGQLHDRLRSLGADAIVDALATLDDLSPAPQPQEGVTYAAKIDKSEARLDWTQDATELARQINGLSPFPGAWTSADGERLKLLQAAPSDTSLGAGETYAKDGRLYIGCGAGSVEIMRAQRAGKRPSAVADMLKGWTPPLTLV